MAVLSRRVARCAGAVACLFLMAIGLHAQEYRYQYFGIDQGLTTLLVQSLYQDRAGFRWVSTEAGVFRYDGERFQKYGRSRGLPAMAGSSFGETADGTLLVGGAEGLFALANGRFEKIALPGSPFVTWMHGIETDAEGRTYIATTSGRMVLTGQRGNFSIRVIAQPPGVTRRNTQGLLLDGSAIG